MDVRIDSKGLLLDQLSTTVEIASERLAGMSQEEFLWEPRPRAWSIRRREDAVTTQPIGPGEWVLDFERPEPDTPSVSTIAWRVGHLLTGLAGRHEWTFGGRSAEPKDLVDFSPDPDVMLAQLWGAAHAWSAAIDAMTESQFVEVGFGQYPYGLDPDLPFAAIVWWENREMIHHTAEAALLRDLWAGAPR